jgi:hypothetical protein
MSGCEGRRRGRSREEGRRGGGVGKEGGREKGREKGVAGYAHMNREGGQELSLIRNDCPMDTVRWRSVPNFPVRSAEKWIRRKIISRF